MRICVFGAGAIGGYMAVRLANTGQDVSVVARGPHLAAIRENGLRLRIGGAEEVAKIAATDDAAELGPQDYLVITLKAHSVPPVADKLTPLIGPETTVVTAMNGVPYWYFHGLDGWEGRRVEAVDPGGAVSRALPPAQALGCVVYPACEVDEPGVIRHVDGDRFTLGEPDGSKSERATALGEAMRKAGFKAPVKPRIRDEIWVKLWGNLAFNPLSALTGETLDVLATQDDLRSVARAMMVEGQAVGEALGTRFAIDVDRRIEGAAGVGAHKTSMLQDLERGRPMEIDALVTAVSELGRITDTATPTIDLVLALVKARGRTAGCYER
ncbi:2-dehydropantoate 2-reductase [Roseitranquillus sediminis]|uniref:2-dehydropantoate 2-reductase n=1 Tax=Roseitranquillus sediminis TaxID=2809051 RepID=UPI001D0BFF91|nr:2-dehydropantoate 2-reductase [Roseitranquillus sediminis]MBM9595656.1 2-dehydropantoate 2-reductase [Roseitranquillus sediminis]